MQRRRAKELVHLRIQCDPTDRSSDSSAVQMCCLYERLVPRHMETDAGKPANFGRMLDTMTCALKTNMIRFSVHSNVSFKSEELLNDQKGWPVHC